MMGRSTRDRACVSDITDELSCSGPTKQVKNCEIVCQNVKKLGNVYNVCSKKEPLASGYGWTNPDPNAPVQGFSFHQVSNDSICVNCNIEPPGFPPSNNGFCLCKDIKNKIDLMDCGNHINQNHRLANIEELKCENI